MEPQSTIQQALVRAGYGGAMPEPAIPGAVSPIHRAVENACHRISLPGRPPAFAKLLHPEMRPFVDPENTIEASRKAGDQGIAPRLLAADAAEGVLLFEALSDDWHWGRMDVLRQPETLERLLAAKRRFHGVAPLAERRSVFELIAAYRQYAAETGAMLPTAFEPAAAAVSRIAAAIAAAGSDMVPCHGDGASANAMVSEEGEVCLIDFEWARQADPAYDLGTVLAELAPFDGEGLLAVEMATGQADSRIFARARLYGAADDLMWALWGFILAHTSPRRHIEFFKYAEWRLLRARTVLEGPRFERWLARV